MRRLKPDDLPKVAYRIPVIIDTREQLPWNFNLDVFDVTRATLRSGDYSLSGMEDRFVLERKSLGDYVSTVIHNWLRFRGELNRLSSCDLAAIIVEADVSDVMERRYESEVNPNSVMGRAHSIYLETGIPTLFWGRRENVVANVEQMFRLAWKKWGMFA